MTLDLSTEGFEINDLKGNLEIKITEPSKYKVGHMEETHTIVLAGKDERTLPNLPDIVFQLNQKIEEYGKAHVTDCCDNEYTNISCVVYFPEVYEDKCGGCGGCPNSP